MGDLQVERDRERWLQSIWSLWIILAWVTAAVTFGGHAAFHDVAESQVCADTNTLPVQAADTSLLSAGGGTRQLPTRLLAPMISPPPLGSEGRSTFACFPHQRSSKQDGDAFTTTSGVCSVLQL